MVSLGLSDELESKRLDEKLGVPHWTHVQDMSFNSSCNIVVKSKQSMWDHISHLSHATPFWFYVTALEHIWKGKYCAFFSISGKHDMSRNDINIRMFFSVKDVWYFTICSEHFSWISIDGMCFLHTLLSLFSLAYCYGHSLKAYGTFLKLTYIINEYWIFFYI